MIEIVFWAVEINLVYFAQKRWLICDCDSFLVAGLSSAGAVNNLVYLLEDRSDRGEFLFTLLSIVGMLWLSFYKN